MKSACIYRPFTVIYVEIVILAGLQMYGMFFSLGLNQRKVKTLQIELQALVDGGIDFIVNFYL